MFIAPRLAFGDVFVRVEHVPALIVVKNTLRCYAHTAFVGYALPRRVCLKDRPRKLAERRISLTYLHVLLLSPLTGL